MLWMSNRFYVRKTYKHTTLILLTNCNDKNKMHVHPKFIFVHLKPKNIQKVLRNHFCLFNIVILSIYVYENENCKISHKITCVLYACGDRFINYFFFVNLSFLMNLHQSLFNENKNAIYE